MDWFPFYNSIRIAALSTLAVFFLGLLAAQRVSKAPRMARGILDAVLSLPLVLPPTALGWLILRFLGPKHPIGYGFQAIFGVGLVMNFGSAVLAASLAAFPFLYRLARRAFDRFDGDLADAARTLGRSNAWTFWVVQVPACAPEILAGTALAFARAFGEYGATAMAAGYLPGRTATVPAALFEAWSANDSALAWVLISLAVSGVFLLAVGLLENREIRHPGRGGGRP